VAAGQALLWAETAGDPTLARRASNLIERCYGNGRVIIINAGYGVETLPCRAPLLTDWRTR
jgi:hypothetical protein